MHDVLAIYRTHTDDCSAIVEAASGPDHEAVEEAGRGFQVRVVLQEAKADDHPR